MKAILKFLIVAVAFTTLLQSCNSSKYAGGARHNHGVNNRHFAGY